MTFPIKYGILKVIQPYQERAKLHGKSGRCTRFDSGNFRQSQAEVCCRPAPAGVSRRADPTDGITNAAASPRPLVEAKRLMRNPAEYHYNYRQLFYQQAKLLEDFTDDFSEQASFSSCYPCYRDMNDRQLRTYFTWRTKVRQGIVESTSPSYAELYCYELLHQIGVPDPETGFRMLQQFRQDYTAVSPECRFPISRYGSMTTSFTTD